MSSDIEGVKQRADLGAKLSKCETFPGYSHQNFEPKLMPKDVPITWLLFILCMHHLEAVLGFPIVSVYHNNDVLLVTSWYRIRLYNCMFIIHSSFDNSGALTSDSHLPLGVIMPTSASLSLRRYD